MRADVGRFESAEALRSPLRDSLATHFFSSKDISWLNVTGRMNQAVDWTALAEKVEGGGRL